MATPAGEVEDKKPLPLATSSPLLSTVLTRLATMLMPLLPMLMLPWPCSKVPSQACLARTTRSAPRCLSPASPARVRVPEVSPSTASSAPTEPSSTRTTSSATGGSTSTAQQPKTSTPSTTQTPQTPVQEKHQEVLQKAHTPP